MKSFRPLSKKREIYKEIYIGRGAKSDSGQKITVKKMRKAIFHFFIESPNFDSVPSWNTVTFFTILYYI